MKVFNTLLGMQFKKPRGILGRWALNFMNKKNSPYYGRVIQMLEVRDSDRILEIGFGGGSAIQRITGQNPHCHVTGIDFSKLMFKKALQNNRLAIGQKRVRLICGDFCEHDFGGATFTKIFGINVIYFWEDLNAVFNKLWRLLVKGGRLAVLMSSPERLNRIPFAVDGIFNKYSLEKVRNEFKKSGFVNFHHQVAVKEGTEVYYICVEK